MAQTKFTKGPWVIKPIEDDKEYIRVRGSVLGGKFKIANISDLKNHHYDHAWCKFDRAESLANAHLIAVAPEMYELLSDLVSMDSYELVNFMQNSDDVTKLLAKARGEK